MDFQMLKDMISVENGKKKGIKHEHDIQSNI
jgi:hypothetical protein